MSDKDFFENNKTLSDIIDSDNIKKKKKEEAERIKYQEIMSKPLMTGQDILDLPYEPNDYIIENFLWRNDVAFIIAKEKSGKSVFSSQMAQAITAGKPFLNAFDVARPLNVLYIQAEGTMEETQNRIKKSVKKIEWNPNRWRHYFPAALSLDTKEGYEELVDRIRKDNFKPDIIFIDPLYMGMEGDLSDNKSARAFIRHCRELMKEFETSIVVVHHEHRPKKNIHGTYIEEGDEAIMGSFAWKAFASHTLKIDRNLKTGMNKVTCERSRNGNVIKELMIAYDEESGTFYMEESVENSGAETAVLNYLRTCGPKSACKLKSETGMTEGRVRTSYRKLKEKGLIEIKSKDGGEVIYGIV